MKPYIIGIAGESGVGKSTLTNIIRLYYGINNTTVISTDDLHKWERNDRNWEHITHLNPDANNLELGDIQLSELAHGRSIYRSVYNHDTGNFKAPKKLSPSKIIINQGLHAFYTNKSKSLTNLKIFINTDEDLRVHWKIIRDTEARGYKYNEVLDAIERRRADAKIINTVQKECADIIVNIFTEHPIKNLGDKHEDVNIIMSYDFINHKDDALFSFIHEYNESLRNFIHISGLLGSDINHCQDSGGNLSVKVDKYMLVKSSGYKMKDISRSKGYSTMGYLDIKKLNSSYKYESYLDDSSVFMGKRPSMEFGFHALLKKYVIHTHSIYITALLCDNQSTDLIPRLYKDLKYTYVKYTNPGYDLFKEIKNKKEIYDIYFLENHGIIITAETDVEVMNIFNSVNEIAKQYLESIVPEFKEFSLDFVNIKSYKNFLFPDAVIFNNREDKVATLAANNYINYIINQIGTIRTITHKNVSTLLTLNSEKYRINL